MSRYLARRCLFGLVTIVAVISVVFFLLRAAPGGPFDGERRLPPEIEANLMAAYKLDDPLPVQYVSYLGGLLQGDLGPSFRSKDFSVNDLVATGLPTSLLLGVLAVVIAVSGGLAIGTWSGLSPGSKIDGILMALTNINLAIPTIVAAPLMVLIFAVMLSWFPAGGTGTWHHFVLPAVALALPYLAAIARLIRGSVAEVVTAPHIRTATAKGIGRRRIVTHHILPIASVPLVSFMGPAAAGLLTGSVVVEQIFDLPGIGRYFVQGAINRDYTLVMGVVVVYATAIVVFNLLVDLLYGWLDPRIRLGAQ